MMSISLEDELPVRRLPDDPAWLENFCFDGYDHRRDVGFWIHCGRWWRDHTIWREQVLVYLPGNTYLVHRAWGRRPSDRGPSAALLDLICEDPGAAWRIRYRGPARPTQSAELQRGPLAEAEQYLLDLDLAFTSKRPVWQMTGIAGEKWGKFHTEQTGRIRGHIVYDGRTIEMDGLGWRDHSRGSRDVSGMGRHCWIHGNLSRGRSFALTTVDNLVGGAFVRGLDKVVIWEGAELHDAHCSRPPFLESSAMPPPTYDMVLEYAGGRIEVLADTVRCLPHSTTRHMDCFDGVTPGQAHVVTYEQGTIFTVDGERCDGHTERSYILGA
jgi:hypothetical protein